MNMLEASDPTGGPSEVADWRCATTGMMLADFECKHGRLTEEECAECDVA